VNNESVYNITLINYRLMQTLPRIYLQTLLLLLLVLRCTLRKFLVLPVEKVL